MDFCDLYNLGQRGAYRGIQARVEPARAITKPKGSRPYALNSSIDGLNEVSEGRVLRWRKHVFPANTSF